MKTCINGATTMPYSLQDDIKAAGKARFDGVEIWRTKLDRYLQEHSKEELRSLLMSYGMRVSAICFFAGHVWCPEDELLKRIEVIKKYFELASYIECESLLVCAEPRVDRSHEEVIEAHVDRLRRLADVGEAYDVKVELEWFQDLRDAIKIVELAAHKYLGIMIDTFHWYRGDGDIGHIDLIPKDKLFLVHINDSEDIGRNKLTDKNRLYCGEGVMPLVEILRRLKHKGYEGYLSVEIFRDEYWKKDPLAISLESLRTLKEVMKKATLL